MKVPEYVSRVANAAHTIVEGMAVTFSHLLREPVTVQYPDKTKRPVSETLPPRYRGLLEVDIDICSGCRRCERVCPINVIAIELTKDPSTKKPAMSRFDIDMGKCMFCGLCVEVCASESSGAIHHTREFEGAVSNLDALVYRFIPEGTYQPLYKAPKDETQIPHAESGIGARKARERALQVNPAMFARLRAGGSASEDSAAAGTDAKPSANAKPSTPAKALEAKPVEQVRVEQPRAATLARSVAETKPTVQTEVAVEAKSTVQTEVAAEAKPTAQTEVAAEAKPTVQTEVAAEAKPTAQPEVAAQAKPAVQAKPVEETKAGSVEKPVA